MTDEEYIRRAVELADGWKFYVNAFEDSDNFCGVWTDEIDLEDKPKLDALAAQLVRQVDAIDDYYIEHANDGDERYAWTEVCPHNGAYVVSRSIGSDRTMNTIKAIVDSGVLE